MMRAVDALPYLRGVFGGDHPVTHYRAGQVLMFVNTMGQMDVFAERVHREYAKIMEGKHKRKGG